jgi:hypothetical protein
MAEGFKGPEFLKKKFWKFKDFREIVENSARRKLDKIPKKPIEQIPIYITRLIEILEKPRGKELILKKLLQRYVIKKENITPEIVKNIFLSELAEQMSYSREDLKNKSIKQIVLQEFENVYDTDYENYKPSTEELENKREVIINQQKESLDLWFNYLTSPEARNYPPEFRYWVFSEVLKLGAYDEKKKSFTERTKNTIAPFAPLNQQALGIILDELLKKYENKPSVILPRLTEEEKKDYKRRLQSENFSDLYGWVLAYIKSLILPEERLPIITGEWQEFQNPEEAEKLVSQISNFPTGWCIEGKTIAKNYLKNSRILIYFSQDTENKNIIPRLAIVIHKSTGQITEIRGIADNQHLDPYITPVLEAKLKEIPGGESYLERTKDMKRLAEIYFKHLNGQELDKDDLRFLYQIDRKIEGFGNEADPRIGEILKNRNQKKDCALFFDCRENQIAFFTKELNNETVVLLGDFKGSEYPYENLPPNLRYIKGKADFQNSKVESLGNLEEIGGSADFRYSQIEDLVNLKRIGGNADFQNSKVKSLGNLEEIGGSADFRYSQVEDLGNLRRIGGIAYFKNSKVKSLGNLEEIGGDADFINSRVEDLGNLRRISGFADFQNSKVKSLGNLEKIGGWADFRNYKIENLGNLRKIGGHVYFEDSKIKSLGNLEEISGWADFTYSQVEDLSNLKRIGEKAIVISSQQDLIRKLQEKGFTIEVKNN